MPIPSSFQEFRRQLEEGLRERNVPISSEGTRVYLQPGDSASAVEIGSGFEFRSFADHSQDVSLKLDLPCSYTAASVSPSPSDGGLLRSLVAPARGCEAAGMSTGAPPLFGAQASGSGFSFLPDTYNHAMTDSGYICMDVVAGSSVMSDSGGVWIRRDTSDHEGGVDKVERDRSDGVESLERELEISETDSLYTESSQSLLSGENSSVSGDAECRIIGPSGHSIGRSVRGLVKRIEEHSALGSIQNHTYTVPRASLQEVSRRLREKCPHLPIIVCPQGVDKSAITQAVVTGLPRVVASAVTGIAARAMLRAALMEMAPELFAAAGAGIAVCSFFFVAGTIWAVHSGVKAYRSELDKHRASLPGPAFLQAQPRGDDVYELKFVCVDGEARMEADNAV
uniref:Uncharacterized protein n=1 Tax=Chromera velia CCMP2878 TaxID=1169474 RepID=A0A0G4GLK8_9ALVE|eukprot:Cvel_22436.t1-p1 / transcript=Cvel_22436.t1 / gene=Cvel_22436 / organism=Chromera_velia_CCMP2878 / gene_product=hypothetical protein / transcript_product=hypothetical protein / location=Cvel_scaffold2204:12436-14747(+) / protein_length=395 / sequence_SO=supercontig / SO=protein_coding / is_pseudo=false